LVMPIILLFTFTDGTTELVRIPAEVWRYNNYSISKVFIFKKEVASVAMDPYLETADCEVENNNWPRKAIPSRFDAFQEKGWNGKW
jgi:hypothetical protein